MHVLPQVRNLNVWRGTTKPLGIWSWLRQRAPSRCDWRLATSSSRKAGTFTVSGPLTSVVRELIPAERLTPGKAQRKATTALQAMNQTATAPGLTVDFRQREWGLERR